MNIVYHLNRISYAYKCGGQTQVRGGIGLAEDISENKQAWSILDTSFESVFSKVYQYDIVSRLDSANIPGKGTIDYQFDWVDNRINPGQYEYNNADQLTRIPGQHRYEYYTNGDLHYVKDDSGTTQETHTYSYDGQLTGVSYPGVDRSTVMAWDESGNRITFQSSTRANDTDTYTFVYDITAGVPAVIEEISPTGAVTRYIRGPGGNLIARITGSGETETIQYYHFDEQGSTLFLTDSNGEVTDSYSYDDYGNATHTGSTDQPYQYIGALGYYTHHQDTNFKYLQLGFRFYDPKIGRFTQLDPIGDGLNWYAYCGGDPKNGVDPTGEVWETVVDIASVLVSGYILWNDPTWENFGYYMWDVGAAVTPFVPGSYVARGAKLLKTGVEWLHASEAGTKIGNVVRRVSKTVEECNGSFAELNNAFRRNPRRGSIGIGPKLASSSGNPGKIFNRDQQALIDLVKETRGPISSADADVLLQWGREYQNSPGGRSLGPVLDHRGTDHWIGGDHIRIGPFRHIPVRK